MGSNPYLRLVNDNWNTQACVVDYKALSINSSINYMG